jgi:Tol biopolymer transport system component
MRGNYPDGLGAAPGPPRGRGNDRPRWGIQPKPTSEGPSGFPVQDYILDTRRRKRRRILAWSLAFSLLSTALLLVVMHARPFPTPGIQLQTAQASPSPVEQSSRQTFNGHAECVWCVAFSPDGKRLASGSGDNTVKVWDARTGETMQTLQGHTGRIEAVSFNPEGTILASGSVDGTVKLWNMKTGENLATLPAHDGGVRCAVIGPDGKTLASGGEDKTVKLWDIATGKNMATFRGHTERVVSVAFSPDSKIVASASWDSTGRLWDVSSGRERAVLQDHGSWVISVAFSPNGKRLASGSPDKTIRIWEVATGKLAATFHGGAIECDGPLQFSPDGKCLASARTWASTANLWDVATGKVTVTFKGHMNAVWSVAFSPDGQTLATASMDNRIKLWDVPPRPKLPQTGTISPRELERLWATLAEADAERAFHSLNTLRATPQEAVALVHDRIRPALGPTLQQAPQIARWISDLDSEQFAIREEASDQLEKIGALAEAALREALADKPSLELKLRIEKLLAKIDKDGLQGVRAVELLENLGTTEAEYVLRCLASGTESSSLMREAKTAQERLKRLTALNQ